MDRGAETSVSGRRRSIEPRVDGDPEEPEAWRAAAVLISLERSPTPPVNTRASNPPSEAVIPAMRAPEPMDVHIPREDRLRVAAACACQDLAHIHRPGEREEP